MSIFKKYLIFDKIIHTSVRVANNAKRQLKTAASCPFPTRPHVILRKDSFKQF